LEYIIASDHGKENVYMNNRIIVFLAALISMMYSEAHARWDFDIGTGAVFSGYNDVRIPNRSGTDISLSEELETEPDYFLTVRITHSIDNKHNLSIFAAPLRLTANGKVNKTVKFEGEEFSANIPLTAVYRFDSYRLTYRYDFHRGRNFQAGFGLTAKIRDASISLEDDGKRSEKKNIGFVPLINFRAQWILSKDLSILVDGDALAASQGRAEDVLIAIQYKLDENVALKLGYRILEGGADVDEVYNFTLLNYLVAGSILTF
jgi:hypothetical protein